MKGGNIMAKGFELSLMVGASVTGALDGLAKVIKSMSQVSESTKKLSEVSKKLSTFDEARGKLNNLNEEYNKSSKALKKLKEEYHKTGNGNKEFAKQVSNAEKYVEKLNNSKAKQILAFNKAKTAIEQEGYNLLVITVKVFLMGSGDETEKEETTTIEE